MKLIVQPLGGLCNRMRSIVSAIDVSRRLDAQLTIIWTRDNTLNASFFDIFQPIEYKVIECKMTSLIYKFLYHWYKDFLRYRIIGDSEMMLIREKTDLGDRTVPQSTYIKINENVKSLKGQNLFILSCEYMTLCEDFSIFKMQNSIVRDSFSIENKNIIGLHIRRSDNAVSIQNSPTQLFIEKIKEEIRENLDTRFYLATDDMEEEHYIKNKFGDRILIYKKKSLDRNNPLGIRDAAIDLYNLAHCRKIYGSYGSSFSDIAALWGSIPKEVLRK